MRMTWRVRSWAATTAVLILLAGCGAVTQSAPFEPGEAYYAKLVHDLAHPSMEGRGPGTAGIDKARDYIVDHLQMAGVKPAFGNAYTQTFEVALGIYAPTQTLQYGPTNPNLTAATAGADFEAMGFSANAAFKGQAVFVGYGIRNKEQSYDSLADAGDALRGRVAIAFRYEPMNEQGVSRWTRRAGRWSDAARFEDKANLAAEHGAVAMLIVDPPAKPLSGPLRKAASTANVPRTSIPVYHIRMELLHAMLRAAGRDPEATLRQWQQQADEGAAIDTIDNLTITGEVEIATRKAPTDNIAAILPGRGELKDQVVFIGAHYDHVGYGEVGSRSGTHEIHHGADDNASGTAAVIVLAKRFAQRYAMDRDTPRRTIVFAFFTAEERGLLGSQHMVSNLADMGITQDRIVAMINLDMIGRTKDNKFYVLGTGTGDVFETLVKEANKSVGFDLTLQAAAPANSDHAHFVRRQIPALHFFSGFHADYHMPSDTAEKVNVPDTLRAVQLIDGVLEALVTQVPAVAFIGGEAMQHMAVDPHAAATPEERAQVERRRGARLGIIPDYATTQGADGAAVADVIAEPARSAGLQKDDVIIKWNNTEIANVEQLSAMLNGSEPGDEVTLVVVRNGERITIKLTLESR